MRTRTMGTAVGAVVVTAVLLTGCQPNVRWMYANTTHGDRRPGETSSIAGEIAPQAAGVVVVLEKLLGDSWVDQRRAVTNEGGRFGFQVKLPVGIHAFRVSVAHMRHVGSSPVYIRVREDRAPYLDSYMGHGGDLERGSRRVGSVTYPHSFSSPACSVGGSVTQWDIQGFYKRLTMIVGVSTGADPEAARRYRVLGDGRPLRSGTVTTGQPHILDLPVGGVRNLRFEWWVAQPIGIPFCSQPWSDGEIVFGDPRLHR